MKKVVKIQSIIRAYIARREALKKLKSEPSGNYQLPLHKSSKRVTLEDDVKETAAVVVQKGTV